jgi:Cu2+-exporting ATPase
VPAGETYCCGGCALVSRLIREEGLETFYQLRDGVTAPADGALRPAGEAELGWLE